MAATEMTEEQKVFILRNALLVAGEEMGRDGDHWPVIKSTVHSIMKDYEDWKTEQNVFAEIKSHYQGMIADLQKLADECSKDSKPKVLSTIATLLELYSACFTPIDNSEIHITKEDMAPHILRADAIIKTMESDNG
ncbi:MAG: hypothetical protein AB7H77_10030 [Bdellovibrionales bacterium]